jgi:5-methyltetrahydropteroyltriglutamate--homocysteine methyltransferase
MKSSSDRIITTHTGSLPRPASLTDRHDRQAVKAAIQETVERQLAAGVDVINDGEASKASYSTYVTERLSGFGGAPVAVRRWGYEEFPEYARKQWGEAASPVRSVTAGNPSCDGPVAYQGLSLVTADIANLGAVAAAAPGAAELFLSAASPGVIEMFMPNRYYPGTEDYLFALAEAMKAEYDAIYQAGLVVRLDCPDLACDWARGDRRTVEEFSRTVAQRLEALDYATRDIPGEAMRLHLCWGNYEGPHHTDIPLADIIDLVLKARPAAVSFEGANPGTSTNGRSSRRSSCRAGRSWCPACWTRPRTTSNILNWSPSAPAVTPISSAARTSWPDGLRLRHLRQFYHRRAGDHLGQARSSGDTRSKPRDCVNRGRRGSPAAGSRWHWPGSRWQPAAPACARAA